MYLLGVVVWEATKWRFGGLKSKVICDAAPGDYVPARGMEIVVMFVREATEEKGANLKGCENECNRRDYPGRGRRHRLFQTPIAELPLVLSCGVTVLE